MKRWGLALKVLGILGLLAGCGLPPFHSARSLKNRESQPQRYQGLALAVSLEYENPLAATDVPPELLLERVSPEGMQTLVHAGFPAGEPSSNRFILPGKRRTLEIRVRQDGARWHFDLEGELPPASEYRLSLVQEETVPRAVGLLPEVRRRLRAYDEEGGLRNRSLQRVARHNEIGLLRILAGGKNFHRWREQNERIFEKLRAPLSVILPANASVEERYESTLRVLARAQLREAEAQKLSFQEAVEELVLNRMLMNWDATQRGTTAAQMREWVESWVGSAAPSPPAKAALEDAGEVCNQLYWLLHSIEPGRPVEAAFPGLIDTKGPAPIAQWTVLKGAEAPAAFIDLGPGLEVQVQAVLQNPAEADHPYGRLFWWMVESRLDPRRLRLQGTLRDEEIFARGEAEDGNLVVKLKTDPLAQDP